MKEILCDNELLLQTLELLLIALGLIVLHTLGADLLMPMVLGSFLFLVVDVFVKWLQTS